MANNISGGGFLSGLGSMISGVVESFTLLVSKVLGFTNINVPGGSGYYTSTTTIDATGWFWKGQFADQYLTLDGTTFTPINSYAGSGIAYAEPVLASNGVLFAASTNGGLQKTSNGVTWEVVDSDIYYQSKQDDGVIIFIASDGYIFSNDNGISWTKTSSSSIIQNSNLSINFSAYQGFKYVRSYYIPGFAPANTDGYKKGWILKTFNIDNDGAIFFYSNDLINWVKSAPVGGSGHEADDIVTNAYSRFFVLKGDKLYVSNDFQTWTLSKQLTAPGPYVNALRDNGDGTLAVFQETYKAYSGDGGNNWYEDSAFSNYLANNNSTVKYVSTERGLNNGYIVGFHDGTNYSFFVHTGSINSSNAFSYPPILYVPNTSIYAFSYKAGPDDIYQANEYIRTSTSQQADGETLYVRKGPFAAFSPIEVTNVSGVNSGEVRYLNGKYTFNISTGYDSTDYTYLGLSSDGLTFDVATFGGNFGFRVYAGPYKKTVEVQVSIGNQGTTGAEVLLPVTIYSAPYSYRANIDKLTLTNLDPQPISVDAWIMPVEDTEPTSRWQVINDTIIAGRASLDFTQGSIPSFIDPDFKLVVLPSSVDDLRVSLYGTENRKPLVLVSGGSSITASVANSVEYAGHEWPTSVTYNNAANNLIRGGVLLYFGDNFIKGGQYSPDGKIWTDIDHPLNTNYRFQYSDTYVVNNKLFKHLSNNDCLYSEDGLTWITLQNTELSSRVEEVIYGSNKWIARTYGQMAYSTDLINWTRITSMDQVYVNKIIYANNKFVGMIAGGSGGLVYSADGIAWTQVANGFTLDPSTIDYGSGKYFASGQGMGVYSTDGINWLPSNLSMDSVYYVSHAEGLWVASGYYQGEPAMFKSTDAINWTEINGVVGRYGLGNLYYFAESYKINSGISLYKSTDGITWTEYSYNCPPNDSMSYLAYRPTV